MENKNPNDDLPDKKNSFDKLLKKVRRNPYQIPDSILSQLAEHTAGYMLCALDAEGNLVFHEAFDNMSVASTVQFKLLQILGIRHQQEIEDLKHDILGPPNGEEPEGQE